MAIDGFAHSTAPIPFLRQELGRSVPVVQTSVVTAASKA